jgi:hypothetical protein
MHTGIFTQNMSSDPKDTVLQIYNYSYTFPDTRNCIPGQAFKSKMSVFCPLSVKHKTKPTYIPNKHNKNTNLIYKNQRKMFMNTFWNFACL